ncbi:MAG: ABC transporter ATP-binding protein [Fimbriimonadales bacterium]|nr:ABC transporter ATP-binding protein [Fimbriimonadales bacterium]
MAVLEASDLRVRFGETEVVRGVCLRLDPGETLGVVGESGCGKSMTGYALMGMVPRPGRVTGSILLEGRELLGRPEAEWRSVRGAQIALVMQDPFASLNPVMRVGDQIAEVLELHRGMGRRQARDEAVSLLRQVGVPDAERSARKYPHQMSGGQRQRVVIATAFACRPKVLIADEPTTALDVTLQAQILRLIEDLQEQEGTAVILISHDIGVVAAVADRVAVFYAGRIVEEGPAEAVLRSPAHPYARALLAAMPRPHLQRLPTIPGQPPRFEDLPQGCAFRPRCPLADARCLEDPELRGSGGLRVACWHAEGPKVPIAPPKTRSPES